MNIAQRLASLIAARLRCIESGNDEWAKRHETAINAIYLPSGSGFDRGTTVDLDVSTGERIVLHTAYHHMRDAGYYGAGYYDGWTEHRIDVRASLINDLDIRISGRNRNLIKDHVHDVFFHTLSEEVLP